MSCSRDKMCLKSAPQKLNFVMANAASFSVKTILCKTNNILFNKNY